VAIVFVGLGLVGIALGVWRRDRLLTLLGGWIVLQLVLSNPNWLPLSVAGQVDTITVVTSLFFPLSLGIGMLADQAAAWLRRTQPRIWSPALAGVLGIAVVWGTVQVPTVVHPSRGFADLRDVDAARWIAEQLPTDAKFLVNASVAHWEPDFVVPTDGGYWLPLLAHRRTTLLPMLYPAERGVTPTQIERMERLAEAAARDPTSDETLALLRASGVTYVYLGVGGGPLEERKLAASSYFRPVYRSEGVAIYELVE
jgi:hypothetical protein